MKTHESEAYIAKVLGHLPLEFADREEIASEIRSTIAERTAAGEPVWRTIEDLGDPLELAESYLQDVPLTNASFGPRFIAKVIDLLIPIAVIVCFVIALISFLGAANSDNGGAFGLLASLGLLGIVLVMFGLWGLVLLYPALAEWHFGRTLGKQLMGLRVVRESGARISGGQSLVRQLPWLLQGLWIIDGIFALFTERNQRVAEILSHTRTVERPHAR